MDRNLEAAKPGAICLLVVNRIPEMPRISITSILNSTNEPVYVGFVDPRDVQEFEDNPRINLIDLSAEYSELNFLLNEKIYTGWTNDDFFKIVQLKWVLLRKILEMGFTFVIYSDLDVVWQLNAYQEVKNSFDSRPDISIQIQSFTRSVGEPKLCMGFVAFRNDINAHEFLVEGAKRHNFELTNNPRIGDDDIATILYIEKHFPTWIKELPQTTFPVGVTLNLFRGKAAFPGLVAQEPFIFHANFVVGLENKVLLMKTFLTKETRNELRANYTPRDHVMLIGKRIRILGRLIHSRSA